jgi:hypothetical protein
MRSLRLATLTLLGALGCDDRTARPADAGGDGPTVDRPDTDGPLGSATAYRCSNTGTCAPPGFVQCGTAQCNLALGEGCCAWGNPDLTVSVACSTSCTATTGEGERALRLCDGDKDCADGQHCCLSGDTTHETECLPSCVGAFSACIATSAEGASLRWGCVAVGNPCQPSGAFACAARSCATGQVCWQAPDAGAPACAPSAAADAGGASGTCDGAEDCPPDQVCCEQDLESRWQGTHCMAPADCTMPGGLGRRLDVMLLCQ